MTLIKAYKMDNFYGAQLEPNKIENEIAQTTVFTIHFSYPMRSPHYYHYQFWVVMVVKCLHVIITSIILFPYYCRNSKAIRAPNGRNEMIIIVV